MRTANIYINKKLAGKLREIEKGKKYNFTYDVSYTGPAISLTMPVAKKEYAFDSFPPFFDGLLPEGLQLESLLKHRKIDRDDLFGQITAVGADLVGALTIEEHK